MASLYGKEVNGERPIYPIRNVKCAVYTKSSDVVRSDGFCFTRTLEDKELRKDGDGFKEDGEGPEDLRDGVGIVEEKSKDE